MAATARGRWVFRARVARNPWRSWPGRSRPGRSRPVALVARGARGVFGARRPAALVSVVAMFERFTERSRRVVALSQEEARTLKHNYIGTEHILLGLLREEEGLAARALESLEVTLERVRAQVVRLVGSGEEVTTGQVPFTPRAKKVLELALREARSLGQEHIGTEHILLGLVRENEGVASRILLDLDADSEKIHNQVIRLLETRGGGRGADRPPAGAPEEGWPHAGPTGPDRPRRGRHMRVALAGAAEAPPPSQGDRGSVLMARLEREIRARLHREPDNGDLLVILSELPEGVVGRALAEL